MPATTWTFVAFLNIVFYVAVELCSRTLHLVRGVVPPGHRGPGRSFSRWLCAWDALSQGGLVSSSSSSSLRAVPSVWLATTATRVETAAHRRARRVRTRSRTVLRNFVSGVKAADSSVRAAVRALRGHHSRSTLVPQAQRLLAEGVATMSGKRSAPWQCKHCSQWAKAAVTFCQNCGAKWDAPPPIAPWAPQQPWPTDQQAWYAPHSGWEEPSRQRQRPWSPGRPAQSPRGGKGKGKMDKGKGKDKSKAKAKGGAEDTPRPAAKAPAIGGLPSPPSTSTVVFPKATAVAPESAISEERKLLQALAPHLGQLETLPSALREQFTSLADLEHRQESKTLHAWVTQRTKAKAALVKRQAGLPTRPNSRSCSTSSSSKGRVLSKTSPRRKSLGVQPCRSPPRRSRNWAKRGSPVPHRWTQTWSWSCQAKTTRPRCPTWKRFEQGNVS